MWWAVWIGSFWPKIEVYTDRNGPKGPDGPHENEFWVLSNSEMNITNSYIEKSRWKNGVICLVPMFPSWVMVLKLSKKVHFCNFVLTSARNLCLLKQFTYIHLKGLVTHFQKMVLFFMLWLTVSEILVFEVEEYCSISTESASFLMF